tara:strand:+ start:34038 stop:34862 length:825 start_codon:yes stop_codon:yes gene_type:complete
LVQQALDGLLFFSRVTMSFKDKKGVGAIFTLAADHAANPCRSIYKGVSTMAEPDGSDPVGGFSSSPCFAHDVEQAADGSFYVFDAEQHRDVMRWRKAERERLLTERLAVSAEQRQQWSAAIAHHIAETSDFENKIVSFYWPFKGEPDLRPLMNVVMEKGGSCALPVVVAKAMPLEFWSWKPGEPLDRGVWNIPIPASKNRVTPDIVMAPFVGFDPDHFRLGYGGGFFDRTLAAMDSKPLVIGLGYSMAAVKTIFPQPHDIPMSVIVTENGVQTK